MIVPSWQQYMARGNFAGKHGHGGITEQQPSQYRARVAVGVGPPWDWKALILLSSAQQLTTQEGMYY